MRATHLGWQSWLFEHEGVRLLVDPLLVDEVGSGSLRENIFSPPRRFQWTAFPRVDAILLTHEHEDHLSIPSLARIDRRIPVFLSRRSSIAARTIVSEMGFPLQLVHAGKRLELGGLTVSLFAGDHLGGKHDLFDEWDTLAFLVEADGAGFFTDVDVNVTPEMERAIEDCRGRSGTVARFEERRLGLWGSTLEGQWHELGPGQSLTLSGGKMSAIEPQTDFLSTAPGSPQPPQDPSQPACGERDLGDEGIVELEAGLQELAAFLYGGAHFRFLLSSSDQGGKATYVLALKGGKETLVYEYCPEACAFLRVAAEADLEAHYLGVVRMWATDLLALFHGHCEPRRLHRHYRESWAQVGRKPPRWFRQLIYFFHPLRRPLDYLQRYRAQLDGERQAPLCVLAADRP